MKIGSESKVGDEVEHEGEKGTVKEILGEVARRVAVVEIPVSSAKTVYVAMPDPPSEPVAEQPNEAGTPES